MIRQVREWGWHFPSVHPLRAFVPIEKAPVARGLFTENELYFMLSCEMRVPQLPSWARVPPQVKSTSHCASVQVCPIYSLAIQMLLPSTTAAP
jgi:hypothetical protein